MNINLNINQNNHQANTRITLDYFINNLGTNQEDPSNDQYKSISNQNDTLNFIKTVDNNFININIESDQVKPHLPKGPDPYQLNLKAASVVYKEYLISKRYGNSQPEDLSCSDKMILDWARYFYDEDFYYKRSYLYCLTLTYIPNSVRDYCKKDIDNFFKKFWTQKFLPYQLGTRKIHKRKKEQPICIAFADIPGNPIYRFNKINISDSERLDETKPYTDIHHHAIIKVYPALKEKMDGLVGQNTLDRNKFGAIIKTSYLKECDPRFVIYAAKNYDLFPKELNFGFKNK